MTTYWNRISTLFPRIGKYIVHFSRLQRHMCSTTVAANAIDLSLVDGNSEFESSDSHWSHRGSLTSVAFVNFSKAHNMSEYTSSADHEYSIPVGDSAVSKAFYLQRSSQLSFTFALITSLDAVGRHESAEASESVHELTARHDRKWCARNVHFTEILPSV